MTKMTTPKAAQTLIDEAKAAGLEVTVTNNEQSVDVYIARPLREGQAAHTQVDVYVSWAVVNVAENCRLGFPTSFKPGVRFQAGQGRTFGGEYVTVKSARQARAVVGLPIK